MGWNLVKLGDMSPRKRAEAERAATAVALAACGRANEDRNQQAHDFQLDHSLSLQTAACMEVPHVLPSPHLEAAGAACNCTNAEHKEDEVRL